MTHTSRFLHLFIAPAFALLTACGGGGGGQDGEEDPVALSVVLSQPSLALQVAPGDTIQLVVDDAGGPGATTTVLADQDGDLTTTGDQVTVAAGPVANTGPRSLLWDLSGVPLGVYRLFAVVSDGTQSPATSEGPATVTVESLSFVEHAGGARRDAGLALDELSGGGFLWAGQTRNDNVTFNIGGANPTTFDADGIDATVARYSEDGTLLWVSHWGGPGNFVQSANDVSAFPDGSCVTTGNFVGTTVFGAGEANQTTLTGDNGDIFFTRLNADGTLAWVKQATAAFADTGESCQALPDGSSIFACEFQADITIGIGEVNETTLESVLGQDAFICRLSSTGELLWVRQIGSGSIDTLNGLTRLPNGTMVLSGFHGASVTLGEGEANETTLTGANPFMAAYDDSGDLLWARDVGTTGGFGVEALASFDDGSIAAVGSYQNTVTIDPGGALEQELTSQDGRDVLVMRFDADGSLRWFREARGNGLQSALGVTVVGEDMVLTGILLDSVTFGAGLPNQQTLSSLGSPDIRDVFLARYGGDGTFKWAVRAGGTGHDQGNAVTGGPSGTVVTTGQFEGVTTFGTTDKTSQGEQDIFITRFHGDGSL